MAWITPSVANVNTRMAGAELAALQTAALAYGQTDPTALIIGGVVKELRGRLRNKCTLEAGETIPDNWEHHFLAIVRYRLFTRLPGTSFITPQREQEYQDAVEAMRQLGPILPDEATTADTTPYAGPMAPAHTARTLTNTREDQDGL